MNITTMLLGTGVCMTVPMHCAVLQQHLGVLTKTVVSRAAVLSSDQRL